MKKRQVLSLYWFSAEEQTSTFKRKKMEPFYIKFSEDLNEFVARVYKQQEKSQKLLKPSCCWKTSLVRFSRSTDKTRRQNYSITLGRSFFFLIISFNIVSIFKKIVIPSIFSTISVFSKPSPPHFFLKVLKKWQVLSLFWFAAQQQTSTFSFKKMDPF